MALCLAVIWGIFWAWKEFFVYMRTGKGLSFAVFAPFRPEFGTFACGIRVYMPRAEIIEIWGISGVLGYSEILLSLR